MLYNTGFYKKKHAESIICGMTLRKGIPGYNLLDKTVELSDKSQRRKYFSSFNALYIRFIVNCQFENFESIWCSFLIAKVEGRSFAVIARLPCKLSYSVLALIPVLWERRL